MGKWKCGGGTRSIVMFENSSFNNVDVLNIYRRKAGKRYQKYGLYDINSNEAGCTDVVIFRKLKWNDKILFAKKRPKDIKREKQEIINIEKAYKTLDKSKLIKYYGYCETYGLIFEWIDDFTYVKKIKIPELGLKDVDMIKLKDGTIKYIDFER